MALDEALGLIMHREETPSSGFALTVADLASLTDPVHPVHPKELGGIDKICHGLRVDPTIGLCSDEADKNSAGKTTDGIKFAARRRAFGSNVLVIEGPYMSVPRVTFHMLASHLVCSLVAFVIKRYHNPEDGSRTGQIKTGVLFVGFMLATIAGLLGMVALGDLWIHHKAKKMEMRKRKEFGLRDVATILRDALEQEVDIAEIQVGDILLLQPGDCVPVDGIVLVSHGIACDESGATCEPKIETTRHLHEGGHLVSGITVLSGSGSMLVTAVGCNLLANKAHDSEDGRSSKERIMAQQAPKMCVATIITLLFVYFSRYFMMSMTDGSLPLTRGILADLSKIVAQVSQIIFDSSVDSLLVCGLCLAAYVIVQLRKKRSVTEVLFKEYRRMLVNSAVIVCLAVAKNMLETGMVTIFQKTPTDATTVAYNSAEMRTLRSYVIGITFFCW
ncbi:plasma membrane calcium [Podila horticola]|nr:plasma membrane calcium [Podila horticola]